MFGIEIPANEAEGIIKNFFKPEQFLHRVQIYYAFKNKKGKYKHLSLFGFYE